MIRKPLPESPSPRARGAFLLGLPHHDAARATQVRHRTHLRRRAGSEQHAQGLDALKRYDAKATFFVRGDRARAYPELVRREYQEGHVVGNHSYDHPRLTTLSKPEVERQLRDTNAVLTAAGAPKPELFRPLLRPQTPMSRAWPTPSG